MKIKLFKIIILTLFILCIYQLNSNAAISASSKTVNSGENVSISITSNIPVTSYKVTVTNNAGLTLVNSSGGEGGGTETITDAKATTMTSLATFTYKTPSVSVDTTYTLTFSATIMEDGNLNAVPNSTATATITVKAATNTTPSNPEISKSNNANLSMLATSPVDFKGFKASTTKYYITVENTVTEVDVSFTKGHSAQKVSVSGNKNLQEGSNPVKVVVTAEDGVTTKTYYIYVSRKTTTEDIIPNTIDQENEEVPEVLRLLTIVLDESLNIQLVPEFNPEIFEYTLTIDNTVNSFELNGIPNLNSAEIIIEGNKELKVRRKCSYYNSQSRRV